MSKIFGIGIDIIENDRIKKLIDHFGDVFLKKTFSSIEIEYCMKKYHLNMQIVNYYAKRFAAKEAFVKALGTGFNRYICKTHINILVGQYGAPFVKLENQLEYYLQSIIKSQNYEIFVSLSDEKEFSIANIMITKN